MEFWSKCIRFSYVVPRSSFRSRIDARQLAQNVRQEAINPHSFSSMTGVRQVQVSFQAIQFCPFFHQSSSAIEEMGWGRPCAYSSLEREMYGRPSKS